MTPSDPRVDGIQARLNLLAYIRENGSSDALHASAAQDIAYLLAELRAREEALGRVEDLCATWTKRGESDMAYSKTIPDEDIAMASLTNGADMVESARIVRAAVAAANEGGDRG